MNTSMRTRVRILIGVVGLAFVSIYLAAALGLVKDVNKLVLILVFAIGPAAIIGVWMIRDRLERTEKSTSARLGTVFLTIAFSMFTLMIVVQQTVRLRYVRMAAEAPGQAVKSSLKQIFGIVDLVQQGIDFSFDIFYCVGLILLAAAMYGRPDFGRFLSVFGVAAGAALLAFNLWTFPYIPADSGLIDLGPVTGLWWMLAIVQILRRDIKSKRSVKRDQPGSLL